jgi:hypothetical protein
LLPAKPKGDVTARLTEVLDDLLLTALDRAGAGQLRVMGKADIDAMLGLERIKDAIGCDDVACSTELAGALGVESILSPSVGNLGDKYVLTLAWIDQRSARVLKRQTEPLGSDPQTFDAGVERAVMGLLGGEAAAASLTAASFAGRWVGMGTNTWTTCGSAENRPVGLEIALSASGGQSVSGTFEFAGGGLVSGRGQVDGGVLTFNYLSANVVSAEIKGGRLVGTYTHRSDGCPGGWGGTIDLGRS